MKKRLVWGAGLALLALGACLWAFGAGDKAQQAAPNEGGAADAPGYTMLYQRDITAFTRMDISGAGFEPFTVISDLVYDDSGGLLGVRNSLGQPVLLEGDEGFRFSSYAYQMILLVAQSLPSVGKLDGAADAALGLLTPAIVCRTHYADGGLLTVRIGNLTPTGDNCYAAVDGDDTRYLVPADLYRTFINGLQGMHFLPTSLGFQPSQVTRVIIERPDAAPVLIEKKADTAAIIPYRMTEPIAHDVDKSVFEAALSQLCEALPERYDGRAADAEALAAYGLQAPRLSVTLVIQDKLMARVAIGSDAENGMAYYTIDQSGDVYLIGKAKLGFMNTLSAEGLLDRYVALISVTDITGVTAEADGRTVSLSLKWGDAAGEGKSTPYADEYAIDGVSIGRETFTSVYQRFIAPMFDKLCTTQVRDEAAAPKLTLVFERRDGTRLDVRYYPYDDFYDIAYIDGEPMFLLRSRKVDEAAEGMR